MNTKEYQEYNATKARVAYGMGKTKVPNITLREQLIKKITESKCKPFVPIIFKEKEMTDILFHNPELNKIHSISLDGLECLPYRPDMAFDRWWSAFEILLQKYNVTAWNKKESHIPVIDLFGRFANEVLKPEVNSDYKLSLYSHIWCSLMPDSVTNYGAMRLLIDRELKVVSQFGNIKGRAISILGSELYGTLAKNYLSLQSDSLTVTAQNRREASRKLKRILNGKDESFGDVKKSGIPLESRIEYVISCMLYTSRCERLHGDYFSPFNSDKAKMSLYAHWYWLADTTYILFWVLFKRILDYKGIEHPISSNVLASYIYKISKNYGRLFYKYITPA